MSKEILTDGGPQLPAEAGRRDDNLITYWSLLQTFGVGSKEVEGFKGTINDVAFARRTLILDALHNGEYNEKTPSQMKDATTKEGEEDGD